MAEANRTKSVIPEVNDSKVVESSMSSNSATESNVSSREQLQISKLREANSKYKSLLKMARERIEEQEDEIENLKKRLSLAEESKDCLSSSKQESASISNNGTSSDENDFIVRICQRIRLDNEYSSDTNAISSSNESGKIWALIEYETNPDGPPPYKKYEKWQSFASDASLADFVRRDSGEPLILPPYSLTPEQSAKVESEAKQAVTNITEEFRRFRVRAEVARKQADATVRALHTNTVQKTRRKIEGQDLENELQQARTDHAQLAALQREMAEREAKWKGTYEALTAENKALKSSGAEALLAAQWRQRYETCLREKEKLESNLSMVKDQVDEMTKKNKIEDLGKYELKYRDLKESFRLYRKKAKEIFESQQKGNGMLVSMPDSAAEDAKIAYLRNLMVNYLSSDPAVREHMEGAIGTVLKFSDDEISKIDKRKMSHVHWFKY